MPPAWLNAARRRLGRAACVLAWLLLALGALPAALFVWAALLGAVSVAESVPSWRAFERGPQRRRRVRRDEEDEGE